MSTRLPSHLSLPLRRWPGHSHRFFQSSTSSRRPDAPTPGAGTKSSSDFRSPWFYRVVGIGNFLIIPAVGIYGAFFWNWGDDREHVMQPARRWFQRQKEAFFRLSPSEQELASPGVGLRPSKRIEASPIMSAPPLADVPKGFFKPFFLVKEVLPEGPAAIAGLHNDDLIVSIGDTPVASLAPLKYHALIKSAAQNNTSIELQVIREDTKLSIVLTPMTDGGLGCDLQRFQPGQVTR